MKTRLAVALLIALSAPAVALAAPPVAAPASMAAESAADAAFRALILDGAAANFPHAGQGRVIAGEAVAPPVGAT